MKQRVDLWLVEKGYLSSREQAQRFIMAGAVMIGGKRMEKSSQLIDDAVVDPGTVTIDHHGDTYVSRGAHKLQKAVETFNISITGRTCLDAGASTGGFTDYLLQSGAVLVYAVDVGYGQLAWKLRQDARVKVYERQNIRYFEEKLEEAPSLITADLSFISLNLVFAKFREIVTKPGGELITLIKPQFEAGRDKVGKKGVIRDPEVHAEVLQRLSANAPSCGWYLANLTFSPILGPEGNIEYLGHWVLQPKTPKPDPGVVIKAAWKELKTKN